MRKQPPDSGEVIYEVESPEFSSSATLRIFGEIESLDEITSKLALQPTHAHRKGERRGPRSPHYQHDLWSYSPPIAEHEPLEVHIAALWVAIRPHAEYLRNLKQRLKVDVFCGFRTNCRVAGFEIPYESLRLFTELRVPFGVSVILVDEEGLDTV